MLGDDRFIFLNHEAELSFPDGWNDASLPKLWLYNLHYFDDLGGDLDPACVDVCRDLAERWIADNPVGHGNGWEPYPLSLRIVNWLKHSLGGHALSNTMRDSLALQARALEQKIEWHLLANHLFANAKALTFAGLCFGGAEGDRWLRKGLRILDREIPAQILADGGHVERSPMYHSIILEDLLDLLNASAALPSLVGERRNAWKDAVRRMHSWLATMTHPNGDVAFFNDCALGIAPRLAELEAYAGRIGLELGQAAATPVLDLVASGYVCVNRGPFALMFDAAPIGPDYQPGHAHADTLSFELSVDGQRVFVNSGVSTYDTGPTRAAERATAAHNTVEVDDADSSEVWAAFRVARRARILSRTVRQSGDTVSIEASHNGYWRLGGRATHARTVQVSADSIALVDRVEGEFSKATSRLRLSPGLTAALKEGGRGGVISRDERAVLEWTSSEPAQLTPVMHAVAFNKRVATHQIEFGFNGPSITVQLHLPSRSNE